MRSIDEIDNGLQQSQSIDRERVDNVSQRQWTYHNESGMKKNFKLVGCNEAAEARP
jgi:hypothetical protein